MGKVNIPIRYLSLGYGSAKKNYFGRKVRSSIELLRHRLHPSPAPPSSTTLYHPWFTNFIAIVVLSIQTQETFRDLAVLNGYKPSELMFELSHSQKWSSPPPLIHPADACSSYLGLCRRLFVLTREAFARSGIWTEIGSCFFPSYTPLMTNMYLRNPCPLQLPLMSKTLFYTVSACDCRLEQEDDGPSGEIPTTLRIVIAFIDDGAWKRFHELLDHFPMPIERIVAGKLLALHKRVDQLCARAIRWAKLRRKLKIVASEDIHSKEEVEKSYIEFAEKAHRLDLRIIYDILEIHDIQSN
ncbi:hypothetical protein LXL04_038602 [Taraxacum kok-saghyz]